LTDSPSITHSSVGAVCSGCMLHILANVVLKVGGNVLFGADSGQHTYFK